MIFFQNKTLMITACSFVPFSNAAFGMSEDEYNKGVSEINAKYQGTYDAAQREGEDIKDESGTCLLEGAFDADWEITKISFDVPEVTFRNREMSFHTVKTTFRNKVIAKTKVPKTYFEVKELAFGIKTKIPVIRMEIKEIKTKVPEFKWDRTSFKTKIPEFKSKRVEWKFHILKIKKLKELNIPCKEEKERAEKLSASVENTSNTHQKELKVHTAKYLASQADKLSHDISSAEKEFDSGISSMDAAIQDVRNNGIDPNGVTIEFEGQKMSMVTARAQLVQQKSDALAQMKASHKQITDLPQWNKKTLF